MNINRNAKEEFPINNGFLHQIQGAWESVNGNPDVYIFQGYDGRYCLLAYSYDKEYQRGSFSCYDIDSDEDGYYISIGMKKHRLEIKEFPYSLRIAAWGGYIKC